MGLSTCYDLRFPEMYVSLRDAGAEVRTPISMGGDDGKERIPVSCFVVLCFVYYVMICVCCVLLAVWCCMGCALCVY